MIDLNPERDFWQSKFFALAERDAQIINVLARKAALPPPKDQAGTFVCPYCYLDRPHSANYHDTIADAIDLALKEGIVLEPAELKSLLGLISYECRTHGAVAAAAGAQRKQ